METKEAIEILKKHIDTYKIQLTDGGWEQMVKMGIAHNTITEKIAYQEDAKKQIEAYQMAINVLGNCNTEDIVTKCYLGSPCPYQIP